MADHDVAVGHQHFFDQQANDALSLKDVERLGGRAQARKKGRQGLGQAQGGGTVGRLVGERLQFGSYSPAPEAATDS